MKIINVVGARPNFMKVAPIMRAMKPYRKIKSLLVHTGQHHDLDMSDVFFRDLELSKPDIHLEVGSGTHAVQTARVLERFEKVLFKEKPDLVLVAGDVNSTLACSLAASKLNIKVAHIEAGLRSFDRRMPEEINRILTDHLSDLLFTTCEDAGRNLAKEGIARDKAFLVGNVMVDTLLYCMKKDLHAIGRMPEYAVVTLHRPSNVDDRDTFERISRSLCEIAKSIPIIFPVHPRTRRQIKRFGLGKYYEGNIKLLDPLGYLDFINLYPKAKMVLTDSGGLQEETTVLDIPCLTIRENTERPITIKDGTNTLVGTDEKKIIEEAGTGS
jgi:UDP-N-acetylglucosamine 2-epimerase (non-hydrolysing)